MMKKAGRALFSLFAAATLLLTGFIVYLNLSGAKAYAVESNSMQPTLQRNSLVFIKPVKSISDLEPGDIATISFNDNSGVFTHRITRIDTGKALIYTKGDGNPGEDPRPAPFSSVRGKYWFSLPLIGTIPLHFGLKNTVVVLLCAAAVLVLIRMIFAAVQKNKKRRQMT
ncbi:MAG TPA: signal peptidase I [Clostridiales bacterium]|nr:MAG: Signal peptidase I W [Firmicutes bacterium ADurb.Bin262]HOU10603.1 signal peptidase I [Clostridiales bacterium]HQK74491.1 signal peptidase I [Clostridiales bacterium]